MKCPACKDETLLKAERLGVEIDYCPECRGVWLDRGELDKIIERSQDFPHETVARPQDRQAIQTGETDYRKQDTRKPKKKKKNFLSELFDFD